MSSSVSSKPQHGQEDQAWVEWAAVVPTNEGVEETLAWLEHELQAAEKAGRVSEVGRRLLFDGRRAVKQLQRVLREKNSEAHLQTALREALLLRHDLQAQARNAPFRLSPDPHLARLHTLARSATLLARDLVGEAMTNGRFAADVCELLGVVGDLFAADEASSSSSSSSSKIMMGELGTLERAPGEEHRQAYHAVATMEAEGGPPSQADQHPLYGENDHATYPQRPSRSQLTKGKVVPPSANPLAGPSSDLPEVLPARPDQPIAVYPGTHTVPSVEPAGPEPVVEQLRPRERRLSDEQLAAFHQRFVRAFNTLAQSDASKKILADGLEFLELLWGVAPSLGGESAAEQVLRNEHLGNALRSAKGLLESFLGGRTLDHLVARLIEVYELSLRHKQAHEFFVSAGDFLAKTIANPNLLCRDAYKSKGLHLLKRLREVNDTALKGRLTGLAAEMSALGAGLSADTSLLDLKESIAVLARDLALDQSGRISIKHEVWSQLHAIIAHGVRERWEVSVPDIMLKGDLLEARVVRGKIAARHLVPRDLLIEDRGKMLVSLTDIRHPTVKATANGIRLLLRGINVDMHNALVTFKSAGALSLLPSALRWALSFLPLPELAVQEAGKLSILMGGDGMDLSITLRTHIGQESLFEVERVSCHINGSIDFFISGTKHDTLYNAILTTFAGRWTQDIENAIANVVKTKLEELHNGLAGSLLHNMLAQALEPVKDAKHLAKFVEVVLASPGVREEIIPDLLNDALSAMEEKKGSARTEK